MLLSHTPVAIAQVILLGTPIYYMTGMAPQVGRFAFFSFILWLLSMTVSTLLRTISYATANSKVSQAQGGSLVVLLFLFGGYVSLLLYCFVHVHMYPFSLLQLSNYEEKHTDGSSVDILGLSHEVRN